MKSFLGEESTRTLYICDKSSSIDVEQEPEYIIMENQIEPENMSGNELETVIYVKSEPEADVLIKMEAKADHWVKNEPDADIDIKMELETDLQTELELGLATKVENFVVRIKVVYI